MTTLLVMGAQGSAMIVAVLVLRAFLLNRLPKATFCALWALVAARLLVPLFVKNPLGLWGLASRLQSRVPGNGKEALGPDGATSASTGSAPLPATAPSSPVAAEPSANFPQAAPSNPVVLDPAALDPNSGPTTMPGLLNAMADAALSALPWWGWIWIVGSLLCVLGFSVLYLRGRARFKASAPVTCPQAVQWLRDHPLRRPLVIRSCKGVSTPLTYGILRPVILVPPAFAWDDSQTVDLTLAHEYAHVARFDALWKLILALAVCVHWFNPLVWVMYVVANRDIELSCDARVAKDLEHGQRTAYARMLLAAAQAKPDPATPLISAFAKSSVEERVVSIVKYRPMSWGACIASAAVLIAVPAALATSAPAPSETPEPAPTQVLPESPVDAVPTGIVVAGRPITSHEYTSEEWQALEMLYRFACPNGIIPSGGTISDYPTIWAFREATSQELRNLDASDLLARLGSDGWLLQQVGTNSMAAFITMALVPLTADDWESHAFTGARSVSANGVEGILDYRYSFGFTPATLELCLVVDAPVQEPSLANMGVSAYLACALSLHATFNNMLDSVDSALLGDPDAVVRGLAANCVPRQLDVPYTGRTLNAEYAYRARVGDGAWQASSLVGSVLVEGDYDPTGATGGNYEFESNLVEGSFASELDDDAMSSAPVDVQWFAYEEFGFSRDPYTSQLLYQGEPVRLFVDGYTGEPYASAFDHIRYYYTNPNGTLDLRTEFDSIGNAALPDGNGQAILTTPVYGIAKLNEQEARSVVEACYPSHQDQYPGQTAAVLFGSSTNLPTVARLFAMDSKQLPGYLQEAGYAYDETEKAFRKDGGILNEQTGSILVRALGAPDEDGYRGLSPEQLRAGEPVEAVTASLLFDPHSQPVDDAEAAAAVKFLEEREVAEGLVKTEEREAVNPIAESAAIANKSVGYEADGRQAIWSAYISTTAGVEMGCSYVDYLAEAYRVDPTFEAVAGFGVAPSWTNPEVAAILEGRA